MSSPTVLNVATTIGATQSANHVLNMPTGVTTGARPRLLVAVLSAPTALAYVSGPSGWTKIHAHNRGGAGQLEVWTKPVTASEPSTYTWTHTGVVFVGSIYYIDDVRLNSIVTASNFGYGGSIAFASADTQGAECLILNVATLHPSMVPVTPSATTTEHVDTKTTAALSNGDVAQYGQSFVQPTVGASGVKTAAATALGNSTTLTISLFPDSGNTFPTVQVPVSKVCRPGEIVTFTAVGTDVEGPVTYAWTRISSAGPQPVNASSATMSVTPTAIGAYSYRVTVTDGQGATASKDVGLIAVDGSKEKLSVVTNNGLVSLN